MFGVSVGCVLTAQCSSLGGAITARRGQAEEWLGQAEENLPPHPAEISKKTRSTAYNGFANRL